LPKFGCHDNSLCSLENSDSIFEFTYPEKLIILAKNSYFLHVTEISAFLAYFCPNLVAMATPLTPWKIQIAYLNSTTP